MLLRLSCFVTSGFLALAILPLTAQEHIVLTTPETEAIAKTWEIRGLCLDGDAPNIEVALVSDTGRTFVWRYVVDESTTETQVRNAIVFINDGRFKTQANKTLRQWLLDQMVLRKVKVGTVVAP